MIKRRIRYTEIEVSDVTDSDSCGSDDEAILNKYCPIASKNKPAYVQYVDILSYSTLLFFVSIILYYLTNYDIFLALASLGLIGNVLSLGMLHFW
ncbi:putative integral membrane protein [Cryptosporidium meleagridis]|uniref:Putative integral membrane protein n=1 Tax=Cryptosporidium meleagridis TaxID=93969 RepID=A0A2P4YZ87_9CRYT|nr:putative integral membrane protein [Cryptosporidium meleagridis]